MSNQDQRHQKSFFNLLKETNFFWSLSGAAILLLEKAYTDHNKYKNLGAAVLFTGIFACISAALALSYMTDNWWVIVFIALLWGMTIINLDMLIVGTMIKYSKWSWRAFAGFLARLALAAIIAISISVPFEMTLLNDEIRDEIDNFDRKSLSTETDKVKEDFKELEGLKQRKAELQSRFIDEMQGKDGGSGRVGYRDIAKKIEQEKFQIEQRIQLLELQRDSSLKSTTTSITDNQQRNNKYGFLASYRALHRLEFASEDNSVLSISIGIKILLLFLELMPIISKSIMRRGVYDAYYELEEMKQMQVYDEERAQLAAKNENQLPSSTDAP
jgi:hypothetical protein